MRKPYSDVLVALLKGIVYSDNEKLWAELIKPENEADIKKYFADIFLELRIDKSEGYAYLKQQQSEVDEDAFPKLIEKRQLNYHFSVLCLLLRKHIIENDREGESSKTYLTKEDIVNMVKPFYKVSTNEAQQQKQIESAINKLVDEGLLRRMKTEEENYEINRIIKAFIDGDIVKSSLEKMQEYAKQATE